MQIITIAGNITKDAELRRTNNGDPVLSFSVAVNGIGRDAPSTFFDCSIWGKRATALEHHIRKGGKATVSGTFGTREHNGKTYLTVNANEITLQGSKQEGAASARGGAGRTSYDEPEHGGHADLDDDLPF